MLKDVFQNYRVALGQWLPLLATHLFIRLVVAALLLPLISLLLASTLYFSDQTALTDQDIASFLLTPAGAIGALAILTMALIALVLDVVIATAIIRQGPSGPLAALRIAVAHTLHSVQRLAPLIVRLILTILLISLPFLAVAAGIALMFLTEFDINYYLTQKPPEFLLAAGSIGVILAVLVLLLLIRLSSWAIAMHLTFFDDVPPKQAFDDSRDSMRGNRLRLVGRLVVWFGIRAAAASLVGGTTAFIIAGLTDWSPGNLELVMGVLIGTVLLYSVGNALINAISNGALADLLNDEFDRALFGRAPQHDILQSRGSTTFRRSDAVIVGGLALVAVLGVGTGGVLIERLEKDAAAEIIAHRGAAALAPENTMASVNRALADGADWVEIDVQESADGEIIVVHDSDFMKSSNVATKVWDISKSDLADLDVGSWFDPSFADERVPLLLDVLNAARGRAKVIIELKYYGHDIDLENRVAAIVEEADMAEDIATMSLKYPAVQKMMSLRPDWRAGVLAATSVGDLTGLDGDFLALNQARISTATVMRANDAGKDVYAWTVNDPLSMARMLWIGVDGLITDDPALARRVLEEYNGLSIPERFLLSVSDRISATLDPQEIEAARP